MIFVMKILSCRYKFEPLTPKNSATSNRNKSKIQVQNWETNMPDSFTPRSLDIRNFYQIDVRLSSKFMKRNSYSTQHCQCIRQCLCDVWLSVIPGLRCEIDENRALLSYYAASNGNFLPTLRDNLSVPSSRVKINLYPEDGSDRLCRDVGKELPLLVA
jgi:hypothetical protein